MEYWQLKQRQSLPLEVKIQMSLLRIRQWYEYWDGDVYVGFSGGKDSTVLLHLVRSVYPDVPAVFCDTGLEFPGVRDFVKTIENVTWLKPKMNFKTVISEYGYPVISKEVAEAVEGARRGQKYRLDKLRGILKDKNGNPSAYNMKKYMFLMFSPFKISSKCCDIMKKYPSKKYEKQTGRKGYIGTIATESRLRIRKYLKEGCNAFNNLRAISQPMAFWTELDVWEYIKKFSVKYSTIYDMGYKRTGCVFCMFGCHIEKEPNRFQLMEKTHPKLYDYCMRDIEKGGLGLEKVLDFINVPYKDYIIQLKDCEQFDLCV